MSRALPLPRSVIDSFSCLAYDVPFCPLGPEPDAKKYTLAPGHRPAQKDSEEIEEGYGTRR